MSALPNRSRLTVRSRLDARSGRRAHERLLQLLLLRARRRDAHQARRITMPRMKHVATASCSAAPGCLPHAERDERLSRDHRRRSSAVRRSPAAPRANQRRGARDRARGDTFDTHGQLGTTSSLSNETRYRSFGYPVCRWRRPGLHGSATSEARAAVGAEARGQDLLPSRRETSPLQQVLSEHGATNHEEPMIGNARQEEASPSLKERNLTGTEHW